VQSHLQSHRLSSSSQRSETIQLQSTKEAWTFTGIHDKPNAWDNHASIRCPMNSLVLRLPTEIS
jgi:hypothetical protein